MTIKIASHFAPAGRESHKNFVRLLNTVLDNPLVNVVLESVNGYVLILNEKRQIMAANESLLKAVGKRNAKSLLGFRPGEIFGCIHFKKGPDGCGTSKNCRSCGAAISILTTQATKKSAVEECHMSIKKGGCYRTAVFRVRSSNLTIDEHHFTVFVLTDISSQKKKEVYENIFFHDFNNIIGSLSGWTKLLGGSTDSKEVYGAISRLSEQLQSEIIFHNNLRLAENNKLTIAPKLIHVKDVLDAINIFFKHHPSSEKNKLKIVAPDRDVLLETDQTMLQRILINMVKNAFEANPLGNTVAVTLSAEFKRNHIKYSVHNEGVIPQNVQRHIFERSFSTKSKEGRGFGTYSMKMLGENYLKGQVSFNSSEEVGTIFSIVLPVSMGDNSYVDSSLNQTKVDMNLEKIAKKSKSKNKRVLFVDDDNTMLDLAEIYFKNIGYSVYTCRDGKEALKLFAIHKGRFNIVVTDFSIPGMNGLEVAKNILEIRKNTPVFLATGYDDPKIKQEALELGVRDIFVKPFALQDLINTISKFDDFSFNATQSAGER